MLQSKKNEARNKILLYSTYMLIDVVIVVASAIIAHLLAGYPIYEFFTLTGVLLVVDLVFFLVLEILFLMYNYLPKSVGKSDIFKVLIVCALLFAINLIIVNTMGMESVLRWMFIFTGLSFICLLCPRFYAVSLKYLKFNIYSITKPLKRAIIVGGGSAGVMLIRELLTTEQVKICPVCILDDDEFKIGKTVQGVLVAGSTMEVEKYVKEYDADMIIIAMPSVNRKVYTAITERCLKTGVKVQTVPGIYQFVDGQLSVSALKDVEVKDLLLRPQIEVNLDEIMGYISDKVVLVTGGAGSIGSELCRQIASHNPKQLIILDIYENTTYTLELELTKKYPKLNLVALIGSVRDSGRVESVLKTYKPNIIFHAAAHKHVPLMENSPNETIKNNVLGTYNVANFADKYGVEKFVLISTDKAVNPTNIMGSSKRVCEMIVQNFAKKSQTNFVAVRFGNVLGSNGSVVPLFLQQIKDGGPVTVTHKDITRYFMTIPEAVSLVLQAGAYAKGGEIFVLDMGEPVKISDLAINLIRLCGYEPNVDINIEYTGLRAGEKLYEERLMDEEGMLKTANDLISIGKPIDFDELRLNDCLQKLKSEAYSEGDKIKEYIKELVPTYKINDKN